MGQLPLLGAGGAAGNATVLLKDTFTDADGTSLTSHTMDVGPGWTVYAGSWDVRNDKTEITASTGINAAAADSGHSDATVRADVTPGNNSCGIVGRLTDVNNYWWAECDNNGQAFRLVEYNAASVINRGQVSLTVSGSSTYTVQAVFSGSNITVTLNGGNAISYSSATFNQTATRHGLWSYNLTGDTHDNFQATT